MVNYTVKKFLDDNFLLHNKTAEYLYHEHAEKLPIIDYHSHLPVKQIAENVQFENISQVWLNGDHYKWRAMRANGVSEEFCTGKASDYDKFLKWAETVPNTLRNPLYHWTHLELQRYFNIHELLNPETAKAIYEKTANLLQSPIFRVQGLLQKMNVEVVCTTDDPVDTLEDHIKLRKSSFPVKVLPTWRPDKAMAVENALIYNVYLDALSNVSQMEINSFDQLLTALRKRLQFFYENGCRLSDHGLDNFYDYPYTESDIKSIFQKIRKKENLQLEEIQKYKSAVLYELAIMEKEVGLVVQYHIGAMRNNNTRLFRQLGPDTGFDSIGDYSIAEPMSRFLDKLDKENKLSKTIVYNLNPRDNDMMATMIGNFQDGTVPGKIQWGAAWWFLDQKDGIEKQLNVLSNHGLLSRFVGMLTDSRSFLSYPRHEYFRRILCNVIGTDVENGELPNDRTLLGQMVENICYYNAKNYFTFEA